MPKNSMVVWGDYSNSDTRAILSVLKISGQNFQYINLNVLDNEHLKNARFAAVSPSLDFPVMHEDNFVVLGSSVKNVNYLCATRVDIKKKLMPNDF